MTNQNSISMRPTSSPWGSIQTCTAILPGIFQVSTAGHGGLMLDAEALATLPAPIRSYGCTMGPWRCYEEDCEVGLVFAARVDLYRAKFEKSLQGWERGLAGKGKYDDDFYARHAPTSIANLTAILAKSDAEFLAELERSNAVWFPELFTKTA